MKQKNNLKLLLIFGFFSVIFIIFNYKASKYDAQTVNLFTHSLPFGLNINWYEAKYQIIENETNIGLIVANHKFPFYENSESVFINEIVKYCETEQSLAIYTTTDKGEKVILIDNYESEFRRFNFEIYDTKEFVNIYSQELKNCKDLKSIPLLFKIWSKVGYIYFILLVLFLVKLVVRIFRTTSIN